MSESDELEQMAARISSLARVGAMPFCMLYRCQLSLGF